jgi:CBS domain-containing protein
MPKNKKKAVYTERHRGAQDVDIVFTPSSSMEHGSVPRKKSVSSVMTKHVVAVTAVTFLPEVAQIMRSEDVGALPVVEPDGTLLGIITDRDITVRAVAEGRDVQSTQVAEVYTIEDLVTVSPDTDIKEAEQIMAEHQVRRLPIVEEGNRLVGMVSLSDLTIRDSGEVLNKVTEPGGPHSQASES